VALEEDCRNVVADDLDGDGRVDLLVNTLQVWPEKKQIVHVYRNTIAEGGHWIGFRLQEQAQRPSPVGVLAAIHYRDHSAVRQIITGDSHRSQHSNSIHFGLGQVNQIDFAEFRWADGRTLKLQGLAVDNYYLVHAPAGELPQK